MYSKSKLSIQKLTIIICVIVNFSSIIVASEQPQKNLLIYYGFESNFQDPHYKIYSDLNSGKASFIPILLGRTKLHCARSIEEAEQALKYGADINAQDNNGYTPIQYMILKNFTSVAMYLLKNKAIISDDYKECLFEQCKTQFHLGKGILHYARSTKEAAEMLKYGADINEKDYNGLTPIQYMIMRNLTSIAMFLLTNKAKISESDKKILYEQYKKYKILYPTKF